MAHKKLLIYLLTAVFLAVAVFCGYKATQWDGTVEFSAVVFSGEHREEIRCQQSSSGEYYLFLPSYADLSQVQLRTNTRCPVYLNDRLITGETTCAGLQTDTPYTLGYETGEKHNFTLRLIRSGGVPAMYIDVASGSMAEIHEEKGNEEPGTLRLYSAEGEAEFAGNLDSIKGRGNDSWDKEKKPYSLKLSRSADLLGLGEAQKWVLFSSYNDPAHIRNKAVYDLAQSLDMPYTPGCSWVDLYLNGEYAGLYLLSERNEIHEQRVNIPQEDTFLVSMEPSGRLAVQDYPYVMTTSGLAFRIRSSAFSQDTLTQILQQADNAIQAQDGIDPETGKHWRELIDTDSFARKYLIEEIFGNLDANAASQFFYYTDGKLHAGPVWDYDLALGSHKVWQTQATDAFFAASPHIWSETDRPWFAAMIRQEEFRSRVLTLYREEFRPRVMELLETGIGEYTVQIAAAARMNQLRWECEDFDEHVASVRKYMEDRLTFLDSFWLEEESYHLVTINIRTGANIGCYAVRPGQTLEQFPEDWVTWQGDNYGWHRVDTDEVFDVTQPIYEDADIYLKWYPLPESESELALQEEAAEEPLSLLRLGPAIVFTVMLVMVSAVGLYRSRRVRRKETVHN